MDDLKTSPGPVMLDVVGVTLNDDDERRIAHPLTGGVILFARNYQSRAQLLALTEHIRGLRDDIIIAVDHEGGRVQRFRGDGFTALPPMRRLGQLWDADVLQATKLATSIGYVIACELRASGVDLSFTPVLDLDYGVSKAIGDRALHRDPRVVTLLAKSLNHGLALAGMANCGKHFPGHGFVEADSHLAIPVDGNLGRRCSAIFLAGSVPIGRDAGACDLPGSRQPTGRLLQDLAAENIASATGFRGFDFQRRFIDGRCSLRRRYGASRASRARGGLRYGAGVQSAGPGRCGPGGLKAAAFQSCATAYQATDGAWPVAALGQVGAAAILPVGSQANPGSLRRIRSGLCC